MTEDKTFDVDPAYGGADHPHPHSDPEVEEGYGGERVVYPVQGLLLTSEERRTLRKLTGRRSESSALR